MVRSPATPFRPQFGLLHRLAGGSEQIVSTGIVVIVSGAPIAHTWCRARDATHLNLVCS